MSPDPERTAERPAVVSFIPRAAGCVRGGSHGPGSQLIQVSLLAPRLTDALCPPELKRVAAVPGGHDSPAPVF